LVSNADMGGVAVWAHVGGFVAGVVLIKFFVRDEYVYARRSGRWRPQRLMRDW
jgi:membrane associated rhomboid family serine protease